MLQYLVYEKEHWKNGQGSKVGFRANFSIGGFICNWSNFKTSTIVFWTFLST